MRTERRPRLEDRVVIVTGGANGIGRAYCQALNDEGAHVVVADIDARSAAQVAGALDSGNGGPRALAVETDVTSPQSTTQLAQHALEAFGRIDVLVNNAGSYPHVAFEDIGYDDWRRVIALNLDSVFLCTQAVLEPMRAQEAGKIINVATNLVWTGLAGMAHYIAAKSGVVGVSRALARELGASGITVNVLAPGAVVPASGLSPEGQARVDQILSYQCINRPQRSEDLTGTLVFLCSAESDFTSGQVFTVDGGLTTH